MVKRLLFVGCCVLGALALGATYGRLTAGAPSPSVSVPVLVSAPVSVLSSASGAPLRRDAGIANLAKSAGVSASPEIARLDARRELYESVDALVQAFEFEKARKLLDEDQQRYGDDLAPEWRDLEQSYRLIADCLEHPTVKLRVRAEAFARVSQALTLKPRILAACSEKAR